MTNTENLAPVAPIAKDAHDTRTDLDYARDMRDVAYRKVHENVCTPLAVHAAALAVKWENYIDDLNAMYN